MATDRVDFVNEDDARRIFLRLLEHVAHAAGAHADEHLNEVGARNGEERHARFTRNGAGEQRFASTRRTHQQRTLGNLAAKARELRRVFQELNDFLQFLTRFINRSEEHTSELQSLMRISYAVFCLKKKINKIKLYSIAQLRTQINSTANCILISN